MIVPDVNVLLYAVDERAHAHRAAKAWLEGVLSGTETVAFAWAVMLAFVRLTTNPRMYLDPFDIAEAIGVVRGWLAQPNAVAISPPRRHLDRLEELLSGTGSAGNLVADAHLAALAIGYGAELHSADADFGRFPGLRWVNPLAA